jgi:hypothetical protein
MKFKTLSIISITSAAVAIYALPALAHHSFAMFDGRKKTTLQGTVKDFQWTFPHAWIVMIVPNAAGKMEEWPIEMMPPGTLAKYGWVPKTLLPGMKVTLLAHPLKDGRLGGQFLSVTLPNGKMMFQGRTSGDDTSP